MKAYSRILIIIIPTLFMFTSGSKNQKLPQAEKELAKIYHKEGGAGYKFGSILTELILSDTSTISYPFQQLVDSRYVNITMSNDEDLRFYSWVTPFGGTMLNYGNAFQYKSNGKVYSFEYTPWDYDESYNYIEPIEGCGNGRSFVKIHTINIGEKTYYLVGDWARYNSGHGVGGINAFTIEDGKLKTEKIFKTQNDTLDAIHIEYCFSHRHLVVNNRKRSDWIFSFDENTNTLYVPLINDDISFGYVTDQYLLYQLKDGYMQYIGRDGGFWLHPSIKKFEYLEGIYKTEKFNIRIDYLENDNIRYVSWTKDKTMTDTPDLIIDKGIRIDHWQQTLHPYYEYIFENKEYAYRIYFGKDGEQHLLVEKNGKEILKETIE